MAQCRKTTLFCSQNITHLNHLCQNILAKPCQQRTFRVLSKTRWNGRIISLHLPNQTAVHENSQQNTHLKPRSMHTSAVCNTRQRLWKSQASTEAEEDPSSGNNKLAELSVRLAAENGYLSWMRNTYIMTMVSVAMMGSGDSGLMPVAGVGAMLCAGLNMTVGSMGYLYNLDVLKRRQMMSTISAVVCQVLVVLHLCLWCSVLLVFLPDIQVTELADESDDK